VYFFWNIFDRLKLNEKQLKEEVKCIKSLCMLHINSDGFKQKVISSFQNFNIFQYENELNKEIPILHKENRNKKWIEELRNMDYFTMKTDHTFYDNRLELIEKVSEC
jgi:hypothetical protein